MSTAALLLPLAIPASARVVEAFRGRLVIWLKDDWTVEGKTFTAGSVVIPEISWKQYSGEQIR